MKRRWRTFFLGLAKVFGFAGAGFLKPDLWTKAVEEALKTSSDVVGIVRSDSGVKYSARFILEARSFVDKRNP
jgi:hypothetical protein